MKLKEYKEVSKMNNITLQDIAYWVLEAYKHYDTRKEVCNYIKGKYPYIDPLIIKSMWEAFDIYTDMNINEDVI